MFIVTAEIQPLYKYSYFSKLSVGSSTFSINLVLFRLILGKIAITPQDSRWVGAWWLGFLIAGVISFLAAIPFCFLPKSLKKPPKANKDKTSPGLLENMGATRKTLPSVKSKPTKWSTMLKGKCFVCQVIMESKRTVKMWYFSRTFYIPIILHLNE